jgi:hypothetical protein
LQIIDLNAPIKENLWRLSFGWRLSQKIQRMMSHPITKEIPGSVLRQETKMKTPIEILWRLPPRNRGRIMIQR